MGILKADQPAFVDHLLCQVRNWALPASFFQLNPSGLWQSGPCYSQFKDEAIEAQIRFVTGQSQRDSDRDRIRTQASEFFPPYQAAPHPSVSQLPALAPSSTPQSPRALLCSPPLQPAMQRQKACTIKANKGDLGDGSGAGAHPHLAFLQPPEPSAARALRCLHNAPKELT